MDALLVADQLRVVFTGMVALDGVSVEVRPSEIVAIVGPNGAGKTTLLNAINRSVPLRSGRVWFAGQEITHLRPHEVARLGIARTFQHVEAFPRLTVAEYLTLGREVRLRVSPILGALFYGPSQAEEIKAREAVEDVIDFLELERYRNHPIAALPYGVQKLVDLGRALAAEPQVLLLDEPSSGLSRQEKEDLARFLLRIRHVRGTTIVWIEHDLRLVMDLADRVVVLDYGVKIADGTPQEVLANPRVVEAYLGSVYV